MKVHLLRSLVNPITLAGVVLFTISCVLVTDQPHMLMLTAAQLILVPVMLLQIIEFSRLNRVVTWIAMLSVFLLQFVSWSGGKLLLSIIYVGFTLLIASNGLKRFFRRGFTNWAEISIDVGLMYLFIGGLWFFAYINGVDTGFGPLITWLTAIHFHYSAFLLPVSLGLFGRIHESPMYRWIVPAILAGPMLVAIGITFWPILEVLSVLVYIVAIYSLIGLSFRTRFASRLQAFLIRISYSALGVTILFSMLYALNSAFGFLYVSIGFMLLFHGLVNCILFGLAGVIGWGVSPPSSRQETCTFPVSRIKGGVQWTGKKHPGLVDDLKDFVDVDSLPHSIVHFYEHTEEYQLTASVKWASWFKPMAWCFKLISARMQQLNLPLSSKSTVMTGEILQVDPDLDGREQPRVWVRKVDQSTVFAAIYSRHETDGRTFMNIALPLPYSSMVGILQLKEFNGSLILTSEGEGDPGVYLAAGDILFKLPLSEHFFIRETSQGSLAASHNMKIFGMHFLNIEYMIYPRV
ncbi:YndJ family protein [Bacillus sp. V3]|nr:YndJ family protein [Bacillus sp. V3]